jgi:hypothetical protein
MKKIVFLFGLLFCSSVFAQSNWINVTLDASGIEWFVDVNSIQRGGNSVTFWTKRNYQVRNKFGVLSIKAQHTVNCLTRDEIVRWYVTYDDRDGNGKIIKTWEPKDSWEPIAPDTVMETIYLLVCKSR